MEEAASTKVVECCDWKQKYIELEKRVARMQKEMNSMKDKLKASNKEVKNHFQYLYKREVTNKTELMEVREKVETLSNVIIRLEQKLEDSANKLIAFQARSMRKNLIISGLEEPKNETPQQLSQAVAQFLQQKLKAEAPVPLKICHRLNYVDGSEYRPVIIKLANLEQKSLLLSLGPNLKGLKNNKNRYYYLNEQLPDQLAEEKKYAQTWIKENKSKQVGEQLQMKIYKNKLRINNEPYQKKVKPPSAAEILRLDPTEIESTKKALTVFGESKMLETSEFISYASKVTTAEEVRIAYRKLRLKYPDATHITSAFRLEQPNGPYNQEANDDGEHAAGRSLLKVLQENQLTSVAVFVIRFYGGKHVGPARFDTIKQVANTALANLGVLHPNRNEPTTPRTSNERRTTRSMSVRGRGSTRAQSHLSSQQQTITDHFGRLSQPPTNLASMFRPTPSNSPSGSPTHQSLLEMERDLLSTDHDDASVPDTDDDLMSARDFESDNNPQPTSEADDEDEGQE